MSHPSRTHTDESLRAEREKADAAVGEKLAAIDETADAVIILARTRADEVLAGARAKRDRESAYPSPRLSLDALEKERSLEDKALREERATADETLRSERAQQVSLLSVERVETDKDLLSERARSDESLATRDEFLGVVSHDLQNMLTGMIGFAALIEADSRANRGEQIAAHATRIQRSGARMSRLIGDLVDIASIEAGRLAVTRQMSDPAPVVMEAVDTFQVQAAKRGIELVVEMVTPSMSAAFDPARILQVVINLLSNAIKFTAVGGRVVVRVERIGDEISFSFSDTGIGIPADQLEAVFERFLQITKNDRRGVGLGLYISKCIVKGHGGRIWVESTIGAGSTFCFTLPVFAAA